MIRDGCCHTRTETCHKYFLQLSSSSTRRLWVGCSARKGRRSWKHIPRAAAQQFLPHVPSPRPAISSNFREIKQMDCHIPTRPLHLTILLGSCAGPNVWKGNWLAVVSFSFFLLKKKNLILLQLQNRRRKKNPTPH